VQLVVDTDWLDPRALFLAIRDPRIAEANAHNVNPAPAKGRCTHFDPQRGTGFITMETIALASEPTLLDDIKRPHDQEQPGALASSTGNAGSPPSAIPPLPRTSRDHKDAVARGRLGRETAE
jgi:hypothetical protein